MGAKEEIPDSEDELMTLSPVSDPHRSDKPHQDLTDPFQDVAQPYQAVASNADTKTPTKQQSLGATSEEDQQGKDDGIATTNQPNISPLQPESQVKDQPEPEPGVNANVENGDTEMKDQPAENPAKLSLGINSETGSMNEDGQTKDKIGAATTPQKRTHPSSDGQSAEKNDTRQDGVEGNSNMKIAGSSTDGNKNMQSHDTSDDLPKRVGSEPPRFSTPQGKAQKLPSSSPIKQKAPGSAKASPEAQIAELRAQKAALIASFSALPNVVSMLEEHASSSGTANDSEHRHSEEDVMKVAKVLVNKHIKLLHQYNEIKDVGQGLIGMIAEQRGVRVVDVQEEFGVSSKD